MPRFKMKILRTDEDPNYEEKRKEWLESEEGRASRRMMFDEGRSGRPRFIDEGPAREIVSNALEVELTEEQFDAVKKAVIQHFK